MRTVGVLVGVLVGMSRRGIIVVVCFGVCMGVVR